MEISKENPQQRSLDLPSLADATLYIFHGYYQKTINRIKVFLDQFCIGLSKTPSKQKKKYSALTNQQLSQRGYFLHYIYQCIIALSQISNDLHQSHPKSKASFRSFIEDLLLSLDELAKLTRIKKSQKVQETAHNKINRQVIEILYETEVYVFQMLLRILQANFVYEQQQRYRKEVQELNQRYAFAEHLASQKNISSKREKMLMKRLFSELQTIFMYYHCQVSINRTECNSKPELNCLIHLIKEKLSQKFLSSIFERVNFKCQGQLIVPYILPFGNEEVHLPTSNQSNENNQNSNENASQASIQIQQELYIQEKLEHSQPVQQKPSKLQQAESQSNPSEIILTIKQENKQQQAFHSNNQEIKVRPTKQEREKKAIQASDEDYVQSKVKHLKYQRSDSFEEKTHEKKPSKHSSKNLSFKQKMKVVGHNQRFAHTLCNIKYVMTSRTSKKQHRRQKQQQNFYKLNLINNGPFINYSKQRDHSQQSFLAEETPVHRHRAYLNKS